MQGWRQRSGLWVPEEWKQRVSGLWVPESLAATPATPEPMPTWTPGVPSGAATPQLMSPQTLTPDQTLSCTIVLNGLMKRPMGEGPAYIVCAWCDTNRFDRSRCLPDGWLVFGRHYCCPECRMREFPADGDE